MNKQAMTFLSLFALILVLSMYYLLVDEQSVSVSTKEVSQIETMQNIHDTSRENIVAQNNDIIASAKSSKEEINAALNEISSTQNAADQEKQISTLLQNIGYPKAFIEVEGLNVKVVASKKGATSQDACTIIDTIHEEIGQKYSVEVKFIQD